MPLNSFMNSAVIAADMEDIYRRDHIPWHELEHRTVLITGATGMLASYLVFFLIYLNEYHDAGIHIVAQVRSPEKARARFGAYAGRAYFSLVTHDLKHAWELDASVDYMIHAASLASPQYYHTVPVEVAEPNVIGTYHLLRLAKEKQTKAFLLFSSGDVYGRISSDTGSITEDDCGAMDPLALHSCYGESKRMAETWCRLFYTEYQVPAKIARIAHTYAPTMDLDNDPRVFASFMKCVRDGKDIVMHSDGSACRPFAYVTDAVAGFFLILLCGAPGEAYNVSNDEAFLSIYDLAQMMVGLRPERDLRVVCEKREDGAYLENVLNRANRPVSDKLRALGWQCRFDAEKGFRRVWAYLQEDH